MNRRLAPSDIPKGFTLIELMIVIAIIGILAAAAATNFPVFACRSKQTEAKTTLKAYHVVQQAYKTEHDMYASEDVASVELFANLIDGDQRYEYVVQSATDNTLLIVATGKAGLDIFDDRWTVNEGGVIVNTIPAAACGN